MQWVWMCGYVDRNREGNDATTGPRRNSKRERSGAAESMTSKDRDGIDAESMTNRG